GPLSLVALRPGRCPGRGARRAREHLTPPGEQRAGSRRAEPAGGGRPVGQEPGVDFMAVKRVGILVPGLGIYGGINRAPNWAVTLAKAGHQLEITPPPSAGQSRVPFLAEEDSRLLRAVTEFEARRRRYHAVIATSWANLAMLAELDAE